MENSKYKRYGLVLYFLLKFIAKTMKIEIIRDKNLKKEPVICAFWHNKLVGAVLGLIDISDKRVGLASPSSDGELIAIPLKKMGFDIVRGSSGKDSIKSLLKLVKMVKNGYTAGTPVDGPKGPVNQVKSGMIYLAQKAEVPLIPIGVAFEKKWIFKKTWDKFQLPKPFSKMICILGEPIIIPKEADLDRYTEILKEKLNNLDREAERILSDS